MEMDNSPESRESFVRWQGVMREQLSYAVNLFLTFATASLGYSLVLLRDDKFVPVGVARFLFWLGGASLFISLVVGLVCVITRLNDFRGTAQRARERQRLAAPGSKYEFLASLGKATWALFYTQLGSFAAGGLCLALSLILTFGKRIF